MNEKQLKVFLAVAATGSMNRAAAELSYAPQSVKEVVDGLEQELGCPLFDRSKKGTTLTREGEALMPHASHLLSAADAAREAILRAHVGTDRSQVGVLRMLTNYNQDYPQRDELVRAFAYACPGIEVRSVPFILQEPDDLFEPLREGVADVAVINEALAPLAPDLLFTRLRSLDMTHHCVAAKGHPLCRTAEERDLRVADLLAYPCAYLGVAPPKQLDGITFDLLLEFDRYQMESFCLRGGVCVCCDAYEPFFRDLVSLSLDVEPMPVGLALSPKPAQVAQLFLDFCVHEDGRATRR